MTSDSVPTFGDFLRHARRTAGLTQEELAERSGVSARAISDLERDGNRVPRKDTLELLVAALELPQGERQQWEHLRRRLAGRAPTQLAKSPESRPVASGLPTFLPPLKGRAASEAPSEPGVLFEAKGRIPARLPLVGREREIGVLRSQLQQALDGQGRLVLVSGEAGIGKTHTVGELAAEARGCRVLWGICYEWDGAPAYWPWVQVIRAAIRDRDPASLRMLLGPNPVMLAQIVPELRASFPDLADQPTLDGEAARFRLFESVAAFVTALAGEQPLIIVLDDLHWADTPSLLLLQFVAQQVQAAPLLLLGTYHTVDAGRDHSLADILGELARAPASVRVTLSGLAHDETRAIIAAVAGRELPARVVDAVQHETEGNPFFITEITRFLLAEGTLAPSAAGGRVQIRVPESVREVLGRRLRRLSAECQALLAMAAVIGREFSLRLLASIGEQPADVVLERLDEALQERLVDAGAALGSYRFHHALVQETLYEALPSTRRLRLHRQVGEALEALGSGAPEPPLDELAHHFFQAAPLGDVERALDYTVRVAGRAMSRFAWESAVEHYRRALQLLDLLERPDVPRQCDFLLALGDAQTLAERSAWGSPAARESFLRAAELARAAGFGERLAYAALGFAGRNLMTTPSGAWQVTLLEEALDRLSTDDSTVRARVLARLAIDRREVDLPADPRSPIDPSSRMRQLSDEAVAVARRVGDPASLAFASLARRITCATHDNLAERAALATEALRLADAAGDAELRWWGSFYRFWDAAEVGDLMRERQAFETYLEVSRQAPSPFKAAGVAMMQALFAFRKGNYAAAEDFASRALGEVLLRDVPWLHFHLRREQGRLHELEPHLEHATDLLSVYKTNHALQVQLAVDLGRADAPALFETLAARDFTDIPITALWLGTIVPLAEACVGLGDQRSAQLLYDLLLPYAGRLVAVMVHCTYLGAVSRFLGMLATLLGRWDAAEQHFAHALALNERLGLHPYAAHTRHAWADMLVRRGHPGDRARARELNAQALAAAREIGMTRLERMAAALAERLVAGAAPAPDQAPPDLGLTRREAEVLHLIAAGKTNREIAKALFLSVRTVERHIENLYRKLEIHSRAEAIAFALRWQIR